MGPKSSVVNVYPQAFAYVAPDEYVPMSGYRSDKNDDSIVTPKPNTNCSVVHNPSLLKGWVQAVWSLLNTNGPGPCPRSSHFSAYDSENGLLYIGYGLDKENMPLNDIWVFNFTKNIWTQLPCNGFDLAQRSGARAALFRDYLAIFGGYANKQYIADFHLINVKTFEIIRPECRGPVPAARSSPVIQAYGDKIFIWGGYNGNYLSDLSILDTETKIWHFIDIDIKGRTGCPFVLIDNLLYIHGGAKEENAPMMTINLENNEIGQIMPKGVNINTKIMNSSMVKAGPVLIMLGGRANDDFTHVFAFHLKRESWFVFHIAPDGETVSTADGNVDDIGLFQLPRTATTSLVYRENERAIYGFLGAPLMEPPMIHRLAVGDSIAFINLQDDLLSMFTHQ